MTPDPHRRLGFWVAVVLVLFAVILLAAFVFERRAITVELLYLQRIPREQLPPLYLLYLGYLVLCAAGVAVCLPVAAILTALGGAWFGFAGFPLALVGTTAGSIVPFFIGRRIGAPALAKIDAKIVARLRSGFARNALQFLILMRLLPWAPFSVTTIAAGALEMRPKNFLAATALGFVPSGVALNAIGHGAVRLGDLQKVSVTDLLRQPDFLLLFGGIGALALLDIFRRRLQGRKLSD
jgi:uncharacterized membrane protein YdjX (TVP38/TMEM64 family)